MDTKQFSADLREVVERHGKDIAAFVFSVTYQSPRGIESYGSTMIPVPPRDEEENILRDKCVRDVCKLIGELTKNIYLGRE